MLPWPCESDDLPGYLRDRPLGRGNGVVANDTETNAPDEVPVLAREIALDNVSFSYLAPPQSGCRRDVAARCH